MSRSACSVLVLITAASLSACAGMPDTALAPGGEVSFEGAIVTIDTQPWTYDGNAVIQVETTHQGQVEVQLPARWNLCKAAPVDVQALSTGMTVEVAGSVAEAGQVVVCQHPAHRLQPKR